MRRPIQLMCLCMILSLYSNNIVRRSGSTAVMATTTSSSAPRGGTWSGSGMYYSTKQTDNTNTNGLFKSYFDAGLIENVPYKPIPEDYNLEKVIIFHRHGDRSQIARKLGDNYPERDEIRNTWTSKLPSESLLESLAAVAINDGEIDVKDRLNRDVREYIYSGWDKDNYPYGQLTTKGIEQMISLGEMIGRRYKNILQQNADQLNIKDLFLLRSSNSCRTLQSLRAFLVGFTSQYSNLQTNSLPSIRTASKEKETLFPPVGSSCEAMAARRSLIMAHKPMNLSIEDYDNFESKIKLILGYSSHVPWFSVKEIITCLFSHDLSVPTGITQEDEARLSSITSWIWTQQFSDDILNRYAIGRLLTDISKDLNQDNYVGINTDGESNALLKSSLPQVLVYSGHDSTLVPLMCALNIHDGSWPPYASYLALEIVKDRKNKKLIRAVYNNEEKSMFQQDEIWCPYETFLDRLKVMSIDYDEFDRDSVTPPETVYQTAGVTSVISESDMIESRKEMDEEIQATLGESKKLL